MLSRLRKKTIITKEEIIADIIFFLVALIISFIALYIFDIHWNFYPNGQLFPPEKHVFADKNIYFYGSLWGGRLGFL